MMMERVYRDSFYRLSCFFSEACQKATTRQSDIYIYIVGHAVAVYDAVVATVKKTYHRVFKGEDS